MAKIKCPNCNTKYNGNFCPTCSAPAPEQPEKKKKKWVLPLIIGLVIVMVISCTAGGEDEAKTPSGVQGDSSATGSTTTDSTGESGSSSSGTTTVTLEEVELYNADGIVVKATSIKNDLFGPTIRITASNDSTKNVVITTQSLSVNGYMMASSGLYCDVAAGKKANDDLILMQSELNQAGITTVADVAFYLHIYDSDTFADIATSDLITVNSSASGSFTQAVDDSGDLIYHANDIRVICKGLKQDAIWDGSVVFYMENNSGKPVTVYAENVSINGYMVDVSLWADMRANTRIVDGMIILNLDAVDIDSIDEVTDIEFTLRIINSDNWNEIDTTDVIRLEFN